MLYNTDLFEIQDYTIAADRFHKKIIDLLLGLANLDPFDYGPATIQQSPLYEKMHQLILAKRKLTFVLPAFPAKSANRNKTVGAEADLGEVLGLLKLQKFCEGIEEVYPPGARVLICSDGKVFNDLVLVNDEDLQTYKKSVSRIIQDFRLKNLSTYSLENFYHEERGDIREVLVKDFGPQIEEIKNLVKSDENARNMFCGIHRFVKEDMQGICLELTKNQITKESKQMAYKVIQRSRSWDNLLERVFPETLRLSIHPYPITHHKFGVKLVEGDSRWATPWHNVVLKKNNKFQLVRNQEAIQMKAKPFLFEGKYFYYEL